MDGTTGCARHMDTFARSAADMAMKAAVMFLRAHNLEADPETLCNVLRTMIKAQIPEALLDAKQALACGMDQIATATFKARMVTIGVMAAREAARHDDDEFNGGDMDGDDGDVDGEFFDEYGDRR